MGENRRKNTRHHVGYLEGEGTCQLNFIFNKSSWKCALSCETLLISLCFVNVAIQSGAMAKFWAQYHSMGENRRKTLDTILYTSLGRRHVSLIFSTNLAGNVN